MEHDPALSKTLYYVIADKPCETCRGEGYIEHPAWVDYYREHPDLDADDDIDELIK